MDTGLNQTGTEVSDTDAEVAAEDEAVAVETEPRVAAWSEKEAETIESKLSGGQKLPGDAPVADEDPPNMIQNRIPRDPPPATGTGVIPIDPPPGEGEPFMPGLNQGYGMRNFVSHVIVDGLY
jgi:hypothetical protein